MKYELTAEVNEKGLYRIKALKDFSDVNKGDLGGWVESTYNLSQEGNCWIYDEACVFDKARIFGAARVYDKALIRDEAWVYGTARIFGKARITAISSMQLCELPARLVGKPTYDPGILTLSLG